VVDQAVERRDQVADRLIPSHAVLGTVAADGSIPDDAGFIGFAIANALLDLLVEKGVLTKSDATVMLISVASKFSMSERNVDQRCANTVVAGMPR
jgi:hypothetical protein